MNYGSGSYSFTTDRWTMTEPRDPELTEAGDAPDDDQPQPVNDTPDEKAPPAEDEGGKPPTQGIGLGG